MIKRWKEFNESLNYIVDNARDILLDFNDNGFKVVTNMESDVLDSHNIDEFSARIDKNGELLSNEWVMGIDYAILPEEFISTIGRVFEYLKSNGFEYVPQQSIMVEMGDSIIPVKIEGVKMVPFYKYHRFYQPITEIRLYMIRMKLTEAYVKIEYHQK